MRPRKVGRADEEAGTVAGRVVDAFRRERVVTGWGVLGWAGIVLDGMEIQNGGGKGVQVVDVSRVGGG